MWCERSIIQRRQRQMWGLSLCWAAEGLWGPACIQYLYSCAVTVVYSFTLFPFFFSPGQPSCSCLLRNMEGKCQVCHFSPSHPLSSSFPASTCPSLFLLDFFTVLCHITFPLYSFQIFLLYCFLCSSNYLSSLFIYLSVFIFLLQAQFVLLIITGLSFLSQFICHFHYVLISFPCSSSLNVSLS